MSENTWTPTDGPHPRCWRGDHYEHTECVKPSGRACVDCGEPAGTLWGPMWCPDCDVKRLARISASFAEIEAATR